MKTEQNVLSFHRKGWVEMRLVKTKIVIGLKACLCDYFGTIFFNFYYWIVESFFTSYIVQKFNVYFKILGLSSVSNITSSNAFQAGSSFGTKSWNNFRFLLKTTQPTHYSYYSKWQTTFRWELKRISLWGHQIGDIWVFKCLSIFGLVKLQIILRSNKIIMYYETSVYDVSAGFRATGIWALFLSR